MNCETCQDTGLQPIFEHVSYPVHAPAQRQTRIEPFDFARAERQWEEGDKAHQLLESFTICQCPAGQRRAAAARERTESKGKKSRGWQPRSGERSDT